ncbi:hypothetical protein [Nocardia lasii]|uniref:Uncharacterized protein n=1 Tax=Nocardia lasii TaxID=1616107 RepID=A0ABW1JX30_9NOCA
MAGSRTPTWDDTARGWQVDIVDEAIPGAAGTQSVLRVRPPSDFVARLFGYADAA